MDGHPTIRPFVLYRLKVAKHLCVKIRILHVLLVNRFSTLLRLHIKVYNAASASDALDNTCWIDRMDGRRRRKSASTLRQMDRMLAIKRSLLSSLLASYARCQTRPPGYYEGKRTTLPRTRNGIGGT